MKHSLVLIFALSVAVGCAPWPDDPTEAPYAASPEDYTIREPEAVAAVGPFEWPGSFTAGDMRIGAVRPESVLVGGDLTFDGSGFGDRPGRVEVVFRDSRLIAPGDVVRWRDDRVQVRMPLALAPLVGESAKETVVWLVHSDETSRVGREIRIRPNELLLRPRVRSLVPDEGRVGPGDVLAVEGVNFLSRPGSARMSVGGRRIDPVVETWSDTLLLLRVPEDIVGLVEQEGILFLDNHLGRSTDTRFTFLPRLANEGLTKRYSHTCGLLGFRDTVTAFDFPLINQWRVADYSLHGSSGLNQGCVWEKSPTAHDPSTRLLYWCNALFFVDCSIRVLLEGPAGTRSH